MRYTYNQILTSVTDHINQVLRASQYRSARSAAFASFYGGFPTIVDGQARINALADTREGWATAAEAILSTFGEPGIFFGNPETYRSPGSEIGLGSPYPDVICQSQYKYIAAQVVLWVNDLCGGSADNAIIHRLLTKPMNKKQKASLYRKAQSLHVKNLVNDFYSKRLHPNASWWPRFRGLAGHVLNVNRGNKEAALELYAAYLARLIFDAMGPGGSFDRKFQTSEVMGLLKTMKETADLSLAPILADALSDAGFEAPEYMMNLRSGLVSFASWIFRATGML